VSLENSPDTAHSAIITDHHFVEREGEPWATCSLCKLARAAHAKGPIADTDPGRPPSMRRQVEGVNAVGAIGVPPSHYAGQGMDVFAIIDAFSLDFYEGNCIKYLLRWRKKHGVNDLLKARHYLDEVINRARNENSADTTDT
jgi:hypothetical protein